MSVALIKLMIALGIAGHALNMYCDRILSIFPNGTIKFDNINEIKKDGVLAKLLEGVSAEVPMRSAVLGAFAIVLEFFGYIGLALYTYERSLIMGMVMFVCGAFFCIVAAAYHVKTAMAEYIFLKLERDNRGKDLMLELMQTGTILRVCILGLLVYIGVLIAAIVTGTIGFPVWAVLFTILPIFVLLFPLKIVGTMHIAAMVSMLAWILFI